MASPRGVVDEARYKVFREDGYPGRLKIIGPDSGNRVLTIVVDRPENGSLASSLLAGRQIIRSWPYTLAGQKLGTFLKVAALEAIARRRLERSFTVSLGAGGGTVAVKVIGMQASQPDQTGLRQAAKTQIPVEWEITRGVA